MASCQSSWSSNKNSLWIAASICIRLIGPCVGSPVGRLTHSRKAMLVPFLRCHGYKFGGFFIGMPIDRKVGQRSACRLCQLYIVHDRAQFGLSPLTTDRPGGVYSMSVMLVHVLAKASERLLAHPIHAGGARIGAGYFVGVQQDISATDLVVEDVEAESRLRLRLAIELPLKGPDLIWCYRAHRQSPSPHHLRKRTRSQGPLLRRHYPASTLQ